MTDLKRTIRTVIGGLALFSVLAVLIIDLAVSNFALSGTLFWALVVGASVLPFVDEVRNVAAASRGNHTTQTTADPIERAQQDYIAGEIDECALEQRLEAAMGTDEHAESGHSHSDVQTTEEGVILIEEHAPSGGDGSDRLTEPLDRAEAELPRVVGPERPSGDFHPNAGWGIQLETEGPIHLGQATIDARSSGHVNVELHEYDSGNTQGLVDSTELLLARHGEQDVDLDIDIEEPGQYLLTRDWEAEPDEPVSMRRVMDYAGWDADSDDMLTFHGGAHDVYSDGQQWYYFFNLHVEPLWNKDGASESGAEQATSATVTVASSTGSSSRGADEQQFDLVEE